METEYNENFYKNLLDYFIDNLHDFTYKSGEDYLSERYDEQGNELEQQYYWFIGDEEIDHFSSFKDMVENVMIYLKVESKNYASK